MNELEYSYTVIKYRHDPAAGEVLNVGIVLYCPVTGQVGTLHDSRYRRLSQAFAGFDGDRYRQILTQLEKAISRLGKPLTGNLFEVDERKRFPDVGSLVRTAWPDQGLQYFHGPVMHGVLSDLDLELKDLYDRFVLSQSDRRESEERLNDEDLWKSFEKVLTPRGLLGVLQEVELGPAEVKFPHAYKNEQWHVIEPLSLDYLDGAEMKRRAYEFAGKVTAVRDSEELGSVTLLVGGPRRVDPGKPYDQAKQILRKLGGSVRIFEESELSGFVDLLERELREHNLLQTNHEEPESQPISGN